MSDANDTRMVEPIWKLTVTLEGGDAYEVWGLESLLRRQYDEVAGGLVVDATGAQEITGHTRTADHAEFRHTFRCEHIRGVTLFLDF